jgi:hypothetical protein
MKLFVTVGIPADAGAQVYWSLNIAAHTMARIGNGTQLDFYRALGIPEYMNQSPEILAGYREI